MKRGSLEIMVGVFVIIGLVAIGYLTIKLGRMELVGGQYYIVKARFQSVAGLKVGASIELAGVRVGQVSDISIDYELEEAVVELRILNDLSLSDDSIASVKTSGLIGDKYIKLSLGGSEDILGPGDMITETESPVDFEDLISKYMFGGV